MTTYDIHTDMDPDMLNEVGLHIFQEWIAFALGKKELGGHMLMHPSGKYASSIQFRRYGKSRIAIYTDDAFAPEAQWIEEGHRRVDLKEDPKLRGRTLVMHRGGKGDYGSAGYGDPVMSSSRRKSIWANVREQGFSGFATVPSHTTPENANSWIIPRMEAYAPARILADMVRAFNSAGQAGR